MKKWPIPMIALVTGIVLMSLMLISWKPEHESIRKQEEAAAQIPSITPLPVPPQKVLNNSYHIFQSFNNCGPASLSMALSYYGINETQQTIGLALRPYQVPGGDNDDKSVTMDELAKYAKENYDLIPYHRPNGSIELLQQFINNDMPVITRTWLHLNEDIGHYRIVKGYDDTTQEIIQDDSFENKNLRYSYADFMELWKKYSYEYLVLVPKEKEAIALAILGANRDETFAWKHALQEAKDVSAKNPDDIYARFNVSVAAYHAHDYQTSVAEYEKVADKLPFRTLWYQIEPIQAYYELGNYDKVFAITDQVLNNHNRAFSELYILRGNIYKQQGKLDVARQEYEKAVQYNSNLQEAKDALASL